MLSTTARSPNLVSPLIASFTATEAIMSTQEVAPPDNINDSASEASTTSGHSSQHLPRARSADRSGHSMSSLTLAMERKSALSQNNTDDNSMYSSDEENLAAAQANVAAEGDCESLSSSLREFMSVGVTGEMADGSYTAYAYGISESGSGGGDSHHSSANESAIATSPRENNGTGNSQGLAGGAGLSRLFVHTQAFGHGQDKRNGPDPDGDSTSNCSYSRGTTPSHLNTNGSTGVADECTDTQEKAWAFYGRDLLNIALDFFDSGNENILGLTRERLASTLASTPSSSASRMASFRLLAAEEDGEIMDDLPEFGLATDVLGMGVNDFAVVNRETDRTVLLVRIEEVVSSRNRDSPRIVISGTTPTASIPIHIANSPVCARVNSNDTTSSNSTSRHGASITDFSLPTTRGSHSNLTGYAIHAAATSKHLSKSKQRLSVFCREPGKMNWVAVKKVRVFQGVHLTDSPSNSSNNSEGALLYRGASNAAEVSAIKALVASTAHEIHELQDGDVVASDAAELQTAVSVVGRPDGSSGKYSDSSSVTKGSEATEGVTWQHVTSFGSGSADNDSDSVSQSEFTAASSLAADLYMDGGYNDDLGDDMLEMSMEGSNSAERSSNSAERSSNNPPRNRAISEKSSTSKGSDGALFSLDLDDA